MLFRIEKDKALIMAEIADVRAATDEVGRSKVIKVIFKEKNYHLFHSGLCGEVLQKSYWKSE